MTKSWNWLLFKVWSEDEQLQSEERELNAELVEFAVERDYGGEGVGGGGDGQQGVNFINNLKAAFSYKSFFAPFSSFNLCFTVGANLTKTLRAAFALDKNCKHREAAKNTLVFKKCS